MKREATAPDSNKLKVREKLFGRPVAPNLLSPSTKTSRRTSRFQHEMRTESSIVLRFKLDCGHSAPVATHLEWRDRCVQTRSRNQRTPLLLSFKATRLHSHRQFCEEINISLRIWFRHSVGARVLRPFLGSVSAWCLCSAVFGTHKELPRGTQSIFLLSRPPKFDLILFLQKYFLVDSLVPKFDSILSLRPPSSVRFCYTQAAV